ncbi:MAG: GTPase Era [Chitinophagaceae bacterium]|jgi:GTP-binding protein Era|nr:GTPase Era [Chitinophagaceae bacterium]
MKSGFVAIFGKPNAGKSTLLNAMVGEKLAIVSHKSQTTRHRIRAFLNGPDYQVIFSDTPGIITPEYKLHEKMMGAVKSSLEDADLALLLVDVRDNPEEVSPVFESLRLKVPAIVVLNKTDLAPAETVRKAAEFYGSRSYCREVLPISALKKLQLDALIQRIIHYLPEGDAFFADDDLTDLPTRFFAGELIREKIYELFEQEIPYQATVMVTEFKEQPHIVRIKADIVVQRESQKAILLGEKGSMIKKLGTEARQSIEAFLGHRVYLELFVKVRPKWRDNELHLREYGYS